MMEHVELLDLDEPAPTSSGKTLNYFGSLSEKQRIDLLAKYPGQTLEQLEEVINQHQKLFWYYRVHHTLAISTNYLYFIFQVNTSNEGVKQFIEIISPIRHVSDGVGYGIGVPFAVLDILFFTFTFSGKVAALNDTLSYVHRAPWQKRLQEYSEDWSHEPKKTALGLASTIVTQPILYISNLTSVMSEVNELAPILNKLPWPAKFSLIGTVLYFANSYMANYMNANYYDGVKFWRSNKPWLIGEVWRGNIATPLQIITQGFSATLLRSFPYYYYIAIASEKTMGWWPPAELVAAIVAIHSIVMLYPVTYGFYMDDKLNALEHCSTRTIYQSLEKEIKVNVIKESPLCSATLLFRLFIGGFFGQACAELLSDSIAGRVVGAALGALLFASLLYKAELNRVKATKIFEKLSPPKEESVDSIMHKTIRGRAIHGAADTLNIGSNLSFALSVMGTLTRLSQSNSPFILVAIAIIVVEQMLNSIHFNTNKVRVTLWNIFGGEVKKPAPLADARGSDIRLLA